MSQLESHLKQRNEKLEAENLAAAAEISALKSSIASTRKRHEAAIVKLTNDLTAAQATIKRLEHELAAVRGTSYPLPTAIIGEHNETT